jgi:GNAT superfamily N-acetyltransferase
MSTEAQTTSAPARVSARRCREPELIERVLREDYFDEPVRSMRAAARRAFARSWCAAREEVYFVIAEVSGEYAGFVLAHTLGDQLFKGFARAHPRHLPALAWAKLRPARGPRSEAAGPADEAGRAKVDAEVLALGIGRAGRTFAWAPADGRSGRVSLLFVGNRFRGHGLAPLMLERLSEEMRASGARLVEAHVDPYNLPSVRAFMKSGYEIERMADKDFLARKVLG